MLGAGTWPPFPGAGDVAVTLADLVRRPSVNPMGRDVSGPEYLERRVGDYLVHRFTATGLPWARQTVHPGRDNVVTRLDATLADAPLILWDAHQDTVPAEGMTIEPFSPAVVDGRLYGRGACDVKGGMAAMLVAIERLRTASRPRRFGIVFVATVNEEFGFSGARALARAWTQPEPGDLAVRDLIGRRPAVAIVAEPTGLAIVTTHKGAVRWRIVVHGRSCHSAFPERGANAIYRAGKVIGVLEQLAADLAGRSPDHPCGPPTLNVGTVHGGMGVNLVPDRVVLEIDRRLVPGENPVAARTEVIERIAERCPSEWVEHDAPFLQSGGLPDQSQLPVLAGERPRDLLAAAVGAIGWACPIAAARYGTNASIYSAAGIPSVVFGPGSIDEAHTAAESIALHEVEAAAAALVGLVLA
ncbi:MAG: M20/M25/M40 family metallo-hydrolase [Planctomycetes bacterium]|nr:M20/M25/M40 family metallo-hydrolase [Planctomycetota bacterium]